MKKIILLTFVSIMCGFTLKIEGQAPSWLESLKKNLPEPPLCGLDAQDRIFGGSETAINEHPWIIRLEYTKPDNKTDFHCVGSLINERYILTSAHCVKKIDVSWSLTSVRVGEWNTDNETDCSSHDETFCAPPTRDIKIVKKTTHPKYRTHSKNQHFDVALLRLSHKVEFNKFVKPICLPLDPSLWAKDFTGHTFEIAGWGRTENFTNSNIKLKVTLPFVSNESCNKTFNKPGRIIIDSQICAGGEVSKDSCNQDSGGPLMNYNTDEDIPYWVQVGVISYGASECGKIGLPGVHTRVSSILQWIAETIFE